MKRTDTFNLLFLFAAIVIIFYPVFYTEYLYTDEASQLWYFKNGLNFHASVPQGRFLTYKIFELVFSHINTIHGVIYSRIFSLAGWILCIPVWYFIINKIIEKNNLPKIFTLLSLIYLISMPPFAISIGWASCMELFVACTSSLISGYILYNSIKYDGNLVHVSTTAILLSIVSGIASLFTYQNGFGCFFIPFFIQFIAAKKFSKNINIGLAFSLMIYVFYFILFKYSLRTNGMEASARSTFAINPINKIVFLFTRPLATAFHFTCLFNEENIFGEIVYIILAAIWLLIYFINQKSKSVINQFSFLFGIIIFFVLIYLPSLIVQENYSSNRTLLALNFVTFLLVAETFFSLIKREKLQFIIATILSLIFIINGWYNFNNQFSKPLSKEYSLLKNFMLKNYTPHTTAIYFIQPAENTFEKKYGITRSWDEFGVPSTAKKWAPEPLIKQMIFEKTGNREMAEKLIVMTWKDEEEFQQSGKNISKEVLFIDFDKMLSAY
jgi:hypothetical protein